LIVIVSPLETAVVAGTDVVAGAAVVAGATVVLGAEVAGAAVVAGAVVAGVDLEHPESIGVITVARSTRTITNTT